MILLIAAFLFAYQYLGFTFTSQNIPIAAAVTEMMGFAHLQLATKN